ncbi:MAG: hypothetical protein IPJ42_05930 [Betaproteobacteria bacterium]|nr:hypothetical protein [Betaproteobacteria bacterium]
MAPGPPYGSIARFGLRLQRGLVFTAAAAGAYASSSDPHAHGATLDLFGAGRRRAMRAAEYFMRLMAATRGGMAFDAASVREERPGLPRLAETELKRVSRKKHGTRR